MKSLLWIAIAAFAFSFAISPSATAQQSQPQNADALRAEIDRIEAANTGATSATIQQAYKLALPGLYRRYIEALDNEVREMRTLSASTSDANSRSGIETLIRKREAEEKEAQARAAKLGGGVNTAAPTPQSEPSPGSSSRIKRAAFNDTQTDTEQLKISLLRDRRVTTSDDGSAVSNPASAGSPSTVTPALNSASEKPATSALYPVSNIPLTDRSSDAPTTQASTTTAARTVVRGTVFVTNKYYYKNPEKVMSTNLLSKRIKQLSDISKKTAKQQELLTALQQEQEPFVTASGAPQQDPLEVRPEYMNTGDVNRPLSNVEVSVYDADNPGGDPAAQTRTGALGNYQFSLEPGDYFITATTEKFSTSEPVSVPPPSPNATPIRQDLQLVVKPLGEFSRAIVGFEQAGASSAKSVQKYFFDLTISTPLPFQRNIDPYFGPRSRAWGTVRVTSVPQQVTSSVGTFATGFATQAAGVKVNEIAQAIEFLGGVEIRLLTGPGKLPLPFGSFDNSTTNKFTLSLIAGGGATTPFTPRDTLEVFKVSPGAPGLPAQAQGKDFVAFVSPDRDRFFRQFYAGLRARTYYFTSGNEDIPLLRYPATLDVTFGQNEAVTGGRLRGGVLRLEGFFPLPYENLNYINLFGTAMMKLSRTRITEPLILEPAPAGTTVPASNVVIVTVPQINRDYYRMGVGIDFIAFIKALKAPAAPK